MKTSRVKNLEISVCLSINLDYKYIKNAPLSQHRESKQKDTIVRLMKIVFDSEKPQRSHQKRVNGAKRVEPYLL